MTVALVEQTDQQLIRQTDQWLVVLAVAHPARPKNLPAALDWPRDQHPLAQTGYAQS
jgi:hypothetical protein